MQFVVSHETWLSVTQTGDLDCRREPGGHEPGSKPVSSGFSMVPAAGCLP